MTAIAVSFLNQPKSLGWCVVVQRWKSYSQLARSKKTITVSKMPSSRAQPTLERGFVIVLHRGWVGVITGTENWSPIRVVRDT